MTTLTISARFVPSNAPPKTNSGIKAKSSKEAEPTDDEMYFIAYVVLCCWRSSIINLSVFRGSEEEEEGEEEVAVEKDENM